MVAPILVSGLINIETRIGIDGFLLAYSPVNYPFFGVNSSVSGVGYNVAKALTVLGNPVRFCSLIGRDLAGGQVRVALAADGIDDRYVRDELDATAQSVILYDPDGRRQIHTDLKDIQDHLYPRRFCIRRFSHRTELQPPSALPTLHSAFRILPLRTPQTCPSDQERTPSPVQRKTPHLADPAPIKIDYTVGTHG